MFAHEYEYKIKERRLKRVIVLLAAVCAVSLTVNVLSVRRQEQIRQNYVHSVWGGLRNLEVILSNLYFAIERRDDLWEGSPSHALNVLMNTTNRLSSDISNMAQHSNMRHRRAAWSNDPIPHFFWLERHVLHLTQPVSDDGSNQMEAALDFLDRRGFELRELIRELTVEWEEEWQGETITVTGPDLRMSSRQLFRHISAFTLSVELEAQEYIR